MKQLFFAFWNVENLFDLENSPNRPAWLQETLKKELKGWSDQVLDLKIGQLGKIIRKLNSGLGPDFLGLAEVENKPVLERLVNSLTGSGRNYGIAHHDGTDQRGIDVAFIYDRSLFTAKEQFSHVILKRTGTRDLFQVNFKTQTGRDLIVIGNHWPSRSAGELESEPYRITAGETLSYWANRIKEVCGEDAAILIMGDFNDEPFNRSVKEYALSINNPESVLNARMPKFYNLMWPFLGEAMGTHYFENSPNLLDQFWISRGIVSGNSGIRLKPDSPKIENFSEMTEHGRPRRFGRPPEKKYDPEGFSDHFPISLILQEND